MIGRQFISQAVRVLVVVGLILGPLSVVSSAVAMTHEAMSTMADEMRCRSLDRTTAPDCQTSCPLMVVCIANCLVPAHAASEPVFGLKSVVLRPGSDVLHSPLSEQPPARPPRT